LRYVKKTSAILIQKLFFILKKLDGLLFNRHNLSVWCRIYTLLIPMRIFVTRYLTPTGKR
jgi:hypothetical protein